MHKNDFVNQLIVSKTMDVSRHNTNFEYDSFSMLIQQITLVVKTESLGIYTLINKLENSATL